MVSAREKFLGPESTHPGALHRWLAWQSRRASIAPRPRARRLMAQVAEQFLEGYADERRPATRAYFAKHLRRFLNVYGGFFADEVALADLHAFRRQLLRDEAGYAPKTIAHDLGAVKTLLRWSADQGLSPSLNLRAVKPPQLPPPRPTILTPAEVAAFIARCESADPRLGPWLRVNYLCFLRPSEVIGLVAGEGRWEPMHVSGGGGSGSGGVVERGLFILDRSKTFQRTGVARHIVVTEEARMWLECCRPHWLTLDGYSKSVARALGPRRDRPAWLPPGPRALRHSAASHLHRLGEPRAACDLLLGHLPPRVSLTYNPVDWPALWRSAARLTL